MESISQSGNESVSFSEFSTICEQTQEPVSSNNIPLSVEVSYQSQKLQFKINCTNTSTQDSNCRYYFIYDQTILTTQQLGQLVDLFYLNLKLGDLIKIININFPNIQNSHWIEKTKSQKSIKDLLFSKLTKTSIDSFENLKLLLKKVFVQSSKYTSNYVSVALFLGSLFQINDQLIQKLYQLKQKQKYIYYLWIFIPQPYNLSKQYQRLKTVILLPPSKRKDKIINYISSINQVLLKNVTIKIQCLNGSLIDQNQNQSNKRWTWKDNNIEKYIYSLTKHTFYSEQLILNNDFQKIELSVEIRIESLKGQHYTLLGCLEITGRIQEGQYQSKSVFNNEQGQIQQDVQKIKFSKNKLLRGQI